MIMYLCFFLCTANTGMLLSFTVIGVQLLKISMVASIFSVLVRRCAFFHRHQFRREHGHLTFQSHRPVRRHRGSPREQWRQGVKFANPVHWTPVYPKFMEKFSSRNYTNSFPIMDTILGFNETKEPKGHSYINRKQIHTFHSRDQCYDF
jgi:hypothetical protein